MTKADANGLAMGTIALGAVRVKQDAGGFCFWRYMYHLTFRIDTGADYFAGFLCHETRDATRKEYPTEKGRIGIITPGRTSQLPYSKNSRVVLNGAYIITKVSDEKKQDGSARLIPVGEMYDEIVFRDEVITFDLMPLTENRTQIDARLSQEVVLPYFVGLLEKITEAYPESREDIRAYLDQFAPRIGYAGIAEDETPTPRAETSQDEIVYQGRIELDRNQLFELVRDFVRDTKRVLSDPEDWRIVRAAWDTQESSIVILATRNRTFGEYPIVEILTTIAGQHALQIEIVFDAKGNREIALAVRDYLLDATAPRADSSQEAETVGKDSPIPPNARRLFMLSSVLLEVGDFSEIKRFIAESEQDFLDIPRDWLVKILTRAPNAPLEYFEEVKRGDTPFVRIERRKLAAIVGMDVTSHDIPTPRAEASQAAQSNTDSAHMDPDKMTSRVNELFEKSFGGASPEELMQWIENESGIENARQVSPELRDQQEKYNKEMILLTMKETYERIKKRFGSPQGSQDALHATRNANGDPKKPGKDATREDWYRYKYECDKSGTIRFTHTDLGRALDLSAGTVRNYYSNWLAENKLQDDAN